MVSAGRPASRLGPVLLATALFLACLCGPEGVEGTPAAPAATTVSGALDDAPAASSRGTSAAPGSVTEATVPAPAVLMVPAAPVALVAPAASAALGAVAGQAGGTTESAARSGGEHGRGGEPEDENATRMRSAVRHTVARSGPLVRGLPLAANITWRDGPDPATARSSPPAARLAGHTGRAPGARLLITLQIFRT
ncbi:hypothetical protein ACFVH6_13995 [Spirillospora sp. NPDC127200]